MSTFPMSTPISASENWTGFLDADEKVIWQGQPYPGLLFRGKGVYPILFGWFFFAFSIFWVVGAWNQTKAATGNGSFFALFGIPFVVVGFHLAISQYPWAAFVRRNTWYTLTNKRAIIATKVLGKKTLKSYPILRETTLESDETAGGSVWFSTTTRTDSDGDKITTHIGFIGIEHPREVFTLMRKVQTGDL